MMEIRLQVIALQKASAIRNPVQNNAQEPVVNVTVRLESKDFPQINTGTLMFAVPDTEGQKFHIDEVFVARLGGHAT